MTKEFFIKEVDNLKCLACKEDIVIEAFTTEVFDTGLVFSFKANEEIVIKDNINNDDVYVICEILNEEDDKDKTLKLIFVNNTDKATTILAETPLAKVLSYRKYKSEKEDCLKGYYEIYEGYDVKAFSKKSNILKNVEMILNKDEKPIILNFNFNVDEDELTEE